MTPQKQLHLIKFKNIIWQSPLISSILIRRQPLNICLISTPTTIFPPPYGSIANYCVENFSSLSPVHCKKPQTLTHIKNSRRWWSSVMIVNVKIYFFLQLFPLAHHQLKWVWWWPTNTITIIVIERKLSSCDEENWSSWRWDEKKKKWKSTSVKISFVFFHHAKNNYFVLMQKKLYVACSSLLSGIIPHTLTERYREEFSFPLPCAKILRREKSETRKKKKKRNATIC